MAIADTVDTRGRALLQLWEQSHLAVLNGTAKGVNDGATYMRGS